MSAHASGHRLAETVSRELRSEICDLAPGTALASELQLADRFDVSRIVVREALTSLRSGGLIESRKGSGHFVAAPPVPGAGALPFRHPTATDDADSDSRIGLTDFLQLIEVRAALEVAAAGLSARRRSTADLATMEDAQSRMARAIEGGDVESGVQADLDFHGSIFIASANVYLRQHMEVLMQQLAPMVRTARRISSGKSVQRWKAQQEHRQIFEAIRDGNSRSARAAAQRHIENTRKRLASTLENDGDATDR